MKEYKRFEIVHKESYGINDVSKIIRDNQTGVLYMFWGSGYGGGLTPLVDSEGKPIVEYGRIED